MSDRNEAEFLHKLAAKQESERLTKELLEQQIRDEVNRQLKPIVQRLAELEAKLRSENH